MTGFDFVGAVLLAIGAILLITQRKRRFERTNKFGIERFPGFWAKLKALSSDRLILVASLVV